MVKVETSMSKKSIGQKCAEAIYNWDNRDHYNPPPAIIAQIIDDILQAENTGLNPDYMAASHEDRSTQSFPFVPSHFANWYAIHGIPLGIGRDNARTLYNAAVGTIQSAFDASMVNGRNLAEKLLHTNEVLTSDEETAIDFFTLWATENRRALPIRQPTSKTLRRIEAAFVVLHEKWLTAGHRRDMNEAMDALSLALGRPALCKHPHGFPCCAFKPVLDGELEACEVCKPHVTKIRGNA